MTAGRVTHWTEDVTAGTVTHWTVHYRRNETGTRPRVQWRSPKLRPDDLGVARPDCGVIRTASEVSQLS